MNVLITNNTLTGISQPFDVEGQLTVFAFGLTPTQRVSFWIVKISSAATAGCGCPPYVPQLPGIEEETPYECCNTPVILTADRPWVIIDSPQGAKIIAKLEELVDDEWVPVAPPNGQVVYWDTSATPNVTDCMRGCRCEDITWTPTGFSACDLAEGVVRIEEVSNCGTKRWTECGEIQWVPTGNAFCTDMAIDEDDCQIDISAFEDGPGYYVEMRNQCGNTRWQFVCGPDSPSYYSATGVVRCEGEFWFEQVTNPCGRTLWRNGGEIEWQPTGNFRCAGNFIEIEERSQPCGTVRWNNQDLTVPVTWEATGATRCTASGYEREERNNCGDLRWTFVSTLVWLPTGTYDCRSNINWRQEANQCGDIRWINTGESCGASVHTMTSLSPAAASVIEGQTACWNIALNGPVAGTPLTIEFDLSGADFVRNAYSSPRSITIPPGFSTGQLCIATTDDIVVDGTEQLCVTPRLTARLTNAPATSCINVLDNDSSGSSHTVDYDNPPADVTEGDQACWDIVLDAPVSGSALNLVFQWSGSDAVRNGYANTIVTVPVGDDTAVLCIDTVDDDDIDGTEALCPTLLPNARVTSELSTPPCVNVLDNDAGASVHEVTCVTPPAQAVEGSLVCWEFELDAPVATAPLTVTGSLSGSEQGIHNYPAPSVVVPIGETTGSICVQTIDDNNVEPTRQLCLDINLSSRITAVNDVACVGAGGQASLIFTNVVGVDQTITEGQVLNVRVSLSAPAPVGGLSGTIVFSGSEKTAYPASYPDLPFTIAEGDTFDDYPVTIFNDALVDGTTALYGTLSVSTPAWTVGIPTAGASVLDNDAGGGGGGGGGGCYMSGTMLRTPTGYVPINSLLPYDEVLAFALPEMPNDFDQSWTAWTTETLKGLSYLATRVIHNTPFEAETAITINGGPPTTEDHRYFVTNGKSYGWVQAKDLNPSYSLVTMNGPVQVVDVAIHHGKYTFFKLDVESPDTLIAQTPYGDVLAHNLKCADCPGL